MGLTAGDLLIKAAENGNKVDANSLHEGLNSYPNKEDYKEDTTSLKADTEAIISTIEVLPNIVEDLSAVKDGLLGKWEIKDQQLFMYRADGSVLRVFDLLDKDGNPTDTAVYKREIV